MIDWQYEYLRAKGYWLNGDNEYIRVHTSIDKGGISYITFNKQDKYINLKQVEKINIFELKAIIDEILGGNER